MISRSSSEIDNTPYAGFWVRVIAFVLDLLFLVLIFKVIEPLLSLFHISWIEKGVALFIFWIYYAFSVYKYGATLGKRIVGLRVESIKSEQITLLQATLRAVVALIVYSLILTLPVFLNTIRLYITPIFEWGTYLILFLLISPILMIFFSKKRQVLHDWISKTVVLDINEKEKTEGSLQKYRRYIRALLKVVLFGFILFFIYYYGAFFFVMGTLALKKRKAYDNSFHIEYTLNDYNDTRIRFYEKELERYSKDFIDANGMYDIFSADIHRDIALECIKVFLKEHNSSNWIGMSERFRKSARNKYANTPEKIRRAKNNEEYLSSHFYDYDLNDVNHIIDEIISIWEPEKNSKICNALMPVNKIYSQLFIPRYIQNRENNIRYYESRINSGDNTSYYKRVLEARKNWLDILYEHFPKIYERKLEYERKLKIELDEALKKAEERKRKEAAELEERYRKELNSTKTPLITALKYKKYEDVVSMLENGADIEARDKFGRTPLIYAGCDSRAVKILLDHGADMNAPYNEPLYTAFTWFLSNPRETSECMETLEEYFNHDVDVNYQYKKSETALTIAAKGCMKFETVEKLLEHGADPDRKDLYGMTTRTGLFRYCRDKSAYKEMMKIIDRY